MDRQTDPGAGSGQAGDPGLAPGLWVHYIGERYEPDPDVPFVIGREGDLAIDDNPYLHRRFLVVSNIGGLWWLSNVGSRMSATVSDADSRMQAWLAPGARMPVVFARTTVWFTAGPTTYEFDLTLDRPPYVPTPTSAEAGGGTTMGRATFTTDQVLMILALAEPALRREGRSGSTVPALTDAAGRLGWTTTKFNRKLDYVCQKLAQQGVKGLHGGPDRLATDRRARLVEYAIAARLVTVEDLPLLDRRDDARPVDDDARPWPG
jgi:hypothetical protein